MNFDGGDGVALADVVDDGLVSIGADFAEDGVLAVQPISRHVGNEELRAVGALPGPGFAGISHGQQAGAIELEVGAALIVKLVTGATAARTLGVAPLNHEICNYTVKLQAIVEATLGQVQETGCGHRGLRSKNDQVDIALAGLHRDFFISCHARTISTPGPACKLKAWHTQILSCEESAYLVG